MNQFSNTQKLTAVLSLLAIILFFLFIGCERVDQGNVGLRVNLTGGDKGQAKVQDASGWQFYMRGFTKIYEYPVYQQNKVYDAFQVPSKGGTMFTIHPSFNYAINPATIKEMFQRYRVDEKTLEEGYIKNAMLVALRESTNSFTVDSILNNISVYDAMIQGELQKKLQPYFFVSQFTSNLSPDTALAGVILAKSMAIQESFKIENQQKTIKAQALNDVIKAQRDSTVKVMAAAAEAKSIQLKQDVLKQSPQYIELIKAEKWNGELPRIVTGTGGMFLNLKEQ